jgi:UDP-N-acetylmuramate dehydrogenase
MVKIIEDKKFSELTTFKVGGPIKYYAEAKSEEDVKEVADFAKEKNLPIFVIGGGSDILVSDKLFDGVVVHYTGDSVSLEESGEFSLITSEAGKNWDDLVEFAVAKNLGGIECLSGIPGTVGAAPIQNIGAYGQELKDTFVSLRAFEIEKGKFRTFYPEDCDFGYRESIFKNPEYWQKFIITSVSLNLKKNADPQVVYESLINYMKENNVHDVNLRNVRDAVLAVRKSKFEDPKEVGNAGSFFKNPVIEKVQAEKLIKEYPGISCRETKDGRYKCFAGWFIEKAGWKGKTHKNAGVSPRHALVLINPEGKATATEIVELSEKVAKDVEAKFGVTLTPEVQFINF